MLSHPSAHMQCHEAVAMPALLCCTGGLNSHLRAAFACATDTCAHTYMHAHTHVSPRSTIHAWEDT